MELSKIIIHELLKEAKSKEAKTIYSDELTKNDDRSFKLISALNKNYSRDGIAHAIFDKSEGKTFPEKYLEYSLSERESGQFINFTKQVTGNLEQLIKNKTMATGGYLVFSEYEDRQISYLGVFLIRDVEGEILTKTKKSFEIKPVEYVDTRNLAMGCRINENRLNDEDKNYLSFTRFKQKNVSDYFKNWISIDKLESSSEYTQTLYDIITQLERPIDDNTGKEYDLQVFRDKIYSDIKASPNKTININNLSEKFYNDPDIISEYAQNNNLVIDTEFKYNQKKLRQFTTLEIERDGVTLKFSRGEYRDKVRVDKKDKNLVIIDSPRFADALRKEMERN